MKRSKSCDLILMKLSKTTTTFEKRESVPRNYIFDFARSLVSTNKRRFIEDGFNLDLTQITNNLIAMGFPCQNYELAFRNDQNEVQVFLNTRHHLHYKVYNLCIEDERRYDLNTFQKCAEYGFQDHGPPTLDLLQECVLDIHGFISKNPRNVAAVHCKAGKGRTGCVIACYLLNCNFISNQQEAVNQFNSRRTSNKKGVTIPSQVRQVHIFQLFKEDQFQSPHQHFHLIFIEVVSCSMHGVRMKQKVSMDNFTHEMKLKSEEGTKNSPVRLDVDPKEHNVFKLKCLHDDVIIKGYQRNEVHKEFTLFTQGFNCRQLKQIQKIHKNQKSFEISLENKDLDKLHKNKSVQIKLLIGFTEVGEAVTINHQKRMSRETML